MRTFDGRPLPPNTMASLERLLAQHQLLSEQLKEIETAREQAVAVADPDRLQRMIQLLAGVVGVGVETATTLVHEVFSTKSFPRSLFASLPRSQGAGRFRRHDRHALRQRRFEARAGLSKNGNPG